MKTTLFAAALLALSGASYVRAGIFPQHAFTDDARGAAAAQFLKSPPSARFSALGSGASALNAPDAVFYNPAGAAYIPEGSGAVMLGYESLLQDSGRGAAAWLNGLSRGVIGVGAVYRSDAGLRRYDDFGEPAGSFDAYDAAFAGYYGARTGPADAGVALKYVRSSVADRSAGAVAADIGVLLNERSARGMRAALYARNLGSRMKLGSERAPLPAEFGAGLGWNYVPRLGLFMDGRLPADHAPYLVISGEYAVPFDRGS
ncbi:MAG TPA: hypothetical protein PL037_04830, partial [Elusimicrobiales bacterium]|nr:hypothetical protein [Elusimicrobiales bacterium]